MDISPVNNNVLYAIVEAADRKGGFYKSEDMGESWSKQSGKVTSGNYYQEIFADPIDLGTVYVMDTWMSVTKDGGETFEYGRKILNMLIIMRCGLTQITTITG